MVRSSLPIDDRLPGSFVQRGDLSQKPDAVAVLEREQFVEAPVQVVREIRDLLPELVLRVSA
jgi:hypothetical protein